MGEMLLQELVKTAGGDWFLGAEFLGEEGNFQLFDKPAKLAQQRQFGGVDRFSGSPLLPGIDVRLNLLLAFLILGRD